MNGFQIVREIGRGGFASVYEAVQESVGRRVALKVLAAAATEPEMERRFRSECRTIGELSWHPHVVALFEAGLSVDGRPFMAMEFLPSGSLAEQLKSSGPLDTAEAVRVGIEIADALSAAHDAGVIHRDVKPANMLIGRRGEYLLSDFGIATISDATQSTTGSFSGTYAYCAPEVHKGHRAGPQADVFSLGASLFTLLNGQSAFLTRTDDAPSAVILRVVSEPAPPLPRSVPPGVAALVNAAMSKDPSDRPASAAELRDALRLAITAPASTDPPAFTGSEEPLAAATSLTSVQTQHREPQIAAAARSHPFVEEHNPPASEPVHDATIVRSPDPRSTEPPHRDDVEGRTGRRPVARLGLAFAGAVIVALIALAATSLFSPDDLTYVATMNVGAEPAGVAAGFDAVWVANSADGTVSRIDPTTNTVEATIDVGAVPSGVAIGVVGVWVANSADNTVSKIDPATNTVTATVEVGRFPIAVAANGDGVWVVNSVDSTVNRIDPVANTVLHTIEAGYSEPSGVAAGAEGVWVTHYNATVSRLDPVTNTVKATIEVGNEPPGVTLGADGAWVGNIDGVVTRIDPATNTVSATVEVSGSSSAIAADSNAVWVIDRSVGTLFRIDPATNTVSAKTGVSTDSAGIATGFGAVWITDSSEGTVSRIAPR